MFWRHFCTEAIFTGSVQFQVAVPDPAKLALDLAEEDAEHGGQDEADEDEGSHYVKCTDDEFAQWCK